MENNFDKSIRKALEQYEADFQPMDWDKLEQRMEAQDVEDVTLDSAAYDALHNLEVPYEPEHWDMMRERLADPYALRRRLVKYKVAEIALVVLFIFTLAQYIPFKKTNTDKNNHSIVSEDKNTPSNTAQVFSEESSDTPLMEYNTVNEPNKNTPSLIGSANSIKNNTPSSIAKVARQDSDKIVLNQSSSALENVSNIADNLEHQSITTLSTNPDNASVSNDEALLSIVEKNEALVYESIMFDEFSPLALNQADPLEEKDIESLNLVKEFIKLEKFIKVRIGMALGPDANYVMTPTDNFRGLNIDGFDRFVSGYSGGLVLGFQHSRWEFETGAMYSAVSYSPRQTLEIKGSILEGGYVYQQLRRAELDLLRIPVNLKYNFIDKRKWDVYAFTGISLNTVVESFYDFTVQDAGRSPNAASNQRFIEEQADNKAAFEGFFEGGGLSGNTFFSANLGFGVERYITPRFSIFLQPSYMQQFSKGLGPEKDQINTVSILTGAKVTLKKRKEK